MKKYLYLLILVFILGCNNSLVKDDYVETTKYNFKIENVKVHEKIGELEIDWDLPNIDNISKVRLDIKKGSEHKIVFLEPNITTHKILNDDLKIIKFEITPISKKDELGEKTIVKGKIKIEHTLIKSNEYIDIDNNSIKFLYKTNEDALVNIYVGEKKDKLKIVATLEREDINSKQGYIVDGFIPNKKYFYKIESVIGESIIKSEIYEIDKMAIIDEVSKTNWPKEAIFYEIFVRSFYDSDGDGIGDFRGVAEKLDYLKELGIDGIWLMPTTKSDSYHGYDTVDYYAVEEDYGTMEDFVYLLSKAKEKDIKIIMDLVVNHTGYDNMWMQEAIKSKENRYRDYYVWETPFDDLSRLGEWGQEVWYYTDNNDYYYAVFWSKMPDLNFRNKEVREEMKNIAKFWLEKGVDGFRLDASKHIDDDDSDVTYAWWKDFSMYVKKINKDAFLVGENWTSDLSYIGKFYESLDSSFNFKLSDGLMKMLKGEKFDIIKTINESKDVFTKYSKNYTDTIFLRNHDMERVASILKNDIGKIKLSISLLMTLPGTPFLYYGEEIGQNGRKPDENIREPFDWYKDYDGIGVTSMEKGGFFGNMNFTKKSDGISLEEQIDDENSIYNHYKKMIRLRKDNPILFNGDYKKIVDENNLYGYSISKNNQDMIVIHNFSNEIKPINFKSDNLLNYINIINNKNVNEIININPYETIIIKQDNIKKN